MDLIIGQQISQYFLRKATYNLKFGVYSLWSPCASNLVQFRLLLTKLRHFEKNGTRNFSLIGRHLESVSRTIPVFKHTLAPSEKWPTQEISVRFGPFLSSYRVNIARCNLCARAKVQGWKWSGTKFPEILTGPWRWGGYATVHAVPLLRFHVHRLRSQMSTLTWPRWSDTLSLQRLTTTSSWQYFHENVLINAISPSLDTRKH